MQQKNCELRTRAPRQRSPTSRSAGERPDPWEGPESSLQFWLPEVHHRFDGELKSAEDDFGFKDAQASLAAVHNRQVK